MRKLYIPNNKNEEIAGKQNGIHPWPLFLEVSFEKSDQPVPTDLYPLKIPESKRLPDFILLTFSSSFGGGGQHPHEVQI